MGAHNRADEALYVVELPLARLATADKGRRLDHIWASPALGDRVSDIAIARQYRGAERPSDHVPVTATLEV